MLQRFSPGARRSLPQLLQCSSCTSRQIPAAPALVRFATGPAKLDADISLISDEQITKIEQRYNAMRNEHHELTTEFPEHSHGEQAVDTAIAYRKRLIYRSKQRGWLEVDLLMGSFATKHVFDMSEAELAQYEDILNEETIDIFNFITGKQDVPEHIDTPVLKQLQAYCMENPLGTTPEEYAAAKPMMSN